jgi:hypothetical protein
MHIHTPRLALGPVVAATVAVIANQLLFLGVDGYNGLSGGLRRQNLGVPALDPNRHPRLPSAAAAGLHVGVKLGRSTVADRLLEHKDERRQQEQIRDQRGSDHNRG